MTVLRVNNIKTLRETLCRAQSNVLHRQHDLAAITTDVENLQALINEIDIWRPLGPNGKHEDRHTPHCGCDL